MTDAQTNEALDQTQLQMEVVAPELSDFSRVEVTKYDDSLAYKPPLEVSVFQPDGSVVEGVDAASHAFEFTDGSGNGLSVSIAVAGHIDALHIKGTEPGSKFDYDSLTELFTDVAPKIPAEVVANQDRVDAFAVDMEKPMGKEGIATMGELTTDGILTEAEVMKAQELREGVIELNLSGTSEDKNAFVENYKRENPSAKIQFQLVRGDVIVPVVDAPKRETTELFMVFGPGKQGKTMYTTAPGRFMPKHPDPNQHRGEDGVVNQETFQESANAWFDTVMLVSKQ